MAAGALVEYQPGMDRRQEVELRQAGDGGNGVFLLEDEPQFPEQAGAGEAVEKVVPAPHC